MTDIVRGVGAVITDPAGRLLLVQRGHEPEKGRWSLPGGRIEPGETEQQAVVREVAEETGLVVTCGPVVGTARLPSLVVRDYRAEITGGSLAAGDDADDVCWAGAAERAALPLTTGLAEYLTAHGFDA